MVGIPLPCDSVRAAVVVCVMAAGLAQGQDRVRFVEDVRPILNRHCSRCHGERKSEGGLRLSAKAAAFAAADSGESVIVPGHPARSLLIQRVVSSDADARMPADAEPLSAAEIATLRRWIKAGAEWPDGVAGRHWAYVAPIRPAIPDVDAAEHGNAIDRFINARLRARRLQPNPRLDRARLLRRASLTLTGLPPTVEQLDAFLADTSRYAYERAIDRLLASPHYGERWAQHWLDLARYADSNGFQADQLREIWAYRDWVINSINNDLPFDQFTIEQLAGDLLPNATVQQKIATGFHRTVPCNVEAGVHPEENRTNQVFDRVNTTATVFLGATLECAQCHDHKYDPYSQEEYYRLFSFFNNTPMEVRLNSGVQYELEGPKLELPLASEPASKLQALREKLGRLTDQAQQRKPSARERVAWERSLLTAVQAGVRWLPLHPSAHSSTGGETLSVLPDDSVLVSGPVPDVTSYTFTFVGQPKKSAPVTVLRIEAMTHESLPGSGPGRGDPVRSNFILSELKVMLRNAQGEKPVPLISPAADFSQKNWPVAAAIDGDLKTGWAIAPQFSKPHAATFVLQEPISMSGDDTLIVTLHQNYGRGRTLGRVRVSAFSGEPTAVGLSPKLIAAVKRPKRQRTPKQRKLIDDYFLASDPQRKRLQQQIADVEKQIEAVKPSTTLVMVEMEKPRTTHVLNRGDYLNPGPAVQPGTPTALHPFDTARYAPNRLGFAQWLVSRDNPVLARVTVNRWWAEIFGRGLVSTAEDFGTQSDPPSHPQLLDWLAVEFMESGWSPKRMHKLMVMSAAFQRTAVVTPEALQADPENKWYSRGPRFRLSAELVRDNALAISGLLSTKMSGPPVMPYQPSGIWRAVGRNAPKWKMAEDTDRFRRGIYVVWRRAAPYPSFVNFDAPDRAACVVRRARTNTPLQALTLLNDPAHVEMALGLAVRMVSAGDSATDRIHRGFRLAVARTPRPQEIAILQKVLKQEASRLEEEPGLAGKLFQTVPGYQVPTDIDVGELALWFSVANILLNLDETITNG